MSRVEEDREAQRIEQARIDRDQLNKRIDAKRLDDNKQFTKIMNSRQESNTQQERNNSNAQQQQSNATQALLVKQGYNAQNAGRTMANTGDARLMAKRSGAEAQAAESVASRGEGQRKSLEMVDKGLDAKGPSVGHKGGRGGDGHEKNAKTKDKRESSDPAQQERLAQVFGGPIGGPIMGADGIGAKASQGSAGTAASNAQQIIDQIVKHVRVGHTALTQTPVIQIDLNDDVLAGSRLTLQSGPKGGVMVNIQTIDPDGNVSKLFRQDTNVTDLTQRLAAHDIKLEGMTVDDVKIHIRS